MSPIHPSHEHPNAEFGTVAFIPLRGGSKSIPGKNIKKLAGQPMALWAIRAAAGCAGIERVYVATDDDGIASVVNAEGLPKVEVIGRSAESATDTASTESALLEFANQYVFHRVVLVQATSPLILSSDLEAALARVDSGEADSVLSVVRQKRFLWRENEDGAAEPINYDPARRPRRQDFDGFLVENGAFYITDRGRLLTSKCRLSGRIATHEMEESSYFEIDEECDWAIVDELLRRRSDRAEAALHPQPAHPKIRMFVTDVDGVLTDAGMYYSESGEEIKKFNTRDGLGMRLLREAGIVVGIITSENTQIVERRAAKLKVDFLHQGIENKLQVLRAECDARGIPMEEVAYIGDDVNDLECLMAAGLSFSPINAAPKVLAIVNHVLGSKGGEGAVRQAAEQVLGTQAAR